MYLLDTHTLLWAAGQPEQLSLKVREILMNPDNRIYVSMATIWELSIKKTIGKLSIPESFFTYIFETGYTRLDISEPHLQAYRTLPLLHRDPFDRLLVAQAKSDQLALLSRDDQIRRYDVKTCWE